MTTDYSIFILDCNGVHSTMEGNYKNMYTLMHGGPIATIQSKTSEVICGQ